MRKQHKKHTKTGCISKKIIGIAVVVALIGIIIIFAISTGNGNNDSVSDRSNYHTDNNYSSDDTVSTNDAESGDCSDYSDNCSDYSDNCSDYSEENESVHIDSTPRKLASIQDAREGDLIEFGKYEQDNDFSNGKEKIKWIVLDKDEDELLLISEYVLDGKPYSYGYKRMDATFIEPVNWKECTLRKWLNFEFVEIAFSDDEYDKIKERTVTTDTIVTEDKVFILDYEEVEKYINTHEERMCQPTAFASQTVNTDEVYTIDGTATCSWLLRCNTSDRACGANIDCKGSMLCPGAVLDDDSYGIRPALWVSIK